jgi:hypothetical protein
MTKYTKPKPPYRGGDYEVGYGKPPKATQFRKGQSGNPQGRPKTNRTLALDLADELREKVTVREKGRSQSVSMRRALLKSLLAKAKKGDTRAIKDVLALYERIVREPPLEHMQTITVRYVDSDGKEFDPGQGAKSVRQSGDE